MVGLLASFWQAGSGRVCHTVLWVLSHIDRRHFELKFSRHGFMLCLCTVLLGLAGGLLAFAMFVLFDRVMVALWMELWYCDSEIKWQAATWGMWLLSCLQISFCCSDLCERPCVWLGGCYTIGRDLRMCLAAWLCYLRWLQCQVGTCWAFFMICFARP